MPHSLRVKLKELNSKGILRDTDTNRLIKALDTVDGLQDAIAEINNLKGDNFPNSYYVKIIKKHTGVET